MPASLAEQVKFYVDISEEVETSYKKRRAKDLATQLSWLKLDPKSACDKWDIKLREICAEDFDFLIANSEGNEDKISNIINKGGNTQKVIGSRNNSISIGVQDNAFLRVLPWTSFKYGWPSYRVFARPCPIRPRHGFVESREVSSFQELYALFQEAREQDPEAEVMLTNLLSGAFSAVATNAGIAFGEGNDGVTGGKETKNIPSLIPVKVWNDVVLGYGKSDAFRIKNCTYMELVSSKGEMYITQRRDGPAQQAEADFIPKEMVVKHILYPEGRHDLIAWERMIKEAVPGSVVSLHESSLSSHYAIHAIEHGIPVVASHVVHYNETLTPTKVEIRSLSQGDIEKIAQHVEKLWGMNFIKKKGTDYAALSAGTIHAMSQWDNSPNLLLLRAVAVTTLIRMLYAACLGELRHFTRIVSGCYDEDGNKRRGCKDVEPETHLPARSKKSRFHGRSREGIYQEALEPIDFETLLKQFNRIKKDFYHDGWDGSFGGDAWQKVASHAEALTIALEDFLSNPNERTWKAVVLSANVALHTAHNGGVALSKWTPEYMLDKIAFAPQIGFMNVTAARIALEGEKFYDSNDNSDDR